MGMKRFSAPPALYPQPVPPTSHPAPTGPTPSPAPTTQVPEWGQQQHHHHHHYHHHAPHHDPSGKRVKTDQTLECLLGQQAVSDVTLEVNKGQSVFHAHRAVLEMKSEVLTSLLAKVPRDKDGGGGGGGGKLVLQLEEEAECGEVFSRFLYFLYSGAVWLHQDYVLPLYRLAHKYRVTSLTAHCRNYVLQVLARSCPSPSSSSSTSTHRHHNHNHNINTTSNHNNNNNYDNTRDMHHNHGPPGSALSSPNGNSPPYTGSGFPLDVVCDVYEDPLYDADLRQTAQRLLCCQFRQLVTSERWLRCGVGTVCSLLASDACQVEENLVLVAATDFMKRNRLADKKQIENILSLIRYPRLPRRVLYHLQKNGSFSKFPRVQDLMLAAIKFHAFHDLPEARHDFTGSQFRPRISTAASSSSSSSAPNRRASMHLATLDPCDPCPPAPFTSDPRHCVDSALALEASLEPVTINTTSRQSEV